MTKEKKRNIIIGSLCAVVLLMAVGYAAFQTVLNISGTSNITSNWNIKITDVTTKNIKGTASNNGNPTFTDTTATFKTSLQSPGDSLEYKVTVTNAGNLNAKVDEVTLSDTNNPAIKFTSSGITKGDVINEGSTGTLLVKVEFLESVTSQPENTISDLTVTLDYSQATGNTPSGESAADKLIATTVTTGDGLYEDIYEPGRYVYRGANPNNYITFNVENAGWRIIAVEADGTIKIIRNEMLPEKRTFDSRTTTLTGPRLNESNTYCRLWTDGKYYGCNAWNAVSGDYVNNNFRGTVTKDSELNTYLNGEYYSSLSSSSKSKIQPHSFNKGTVLSGTIESVIKAENADSWTGNIALLSLGDWFKASNATECTSTTNDFYVAGNNHDDYKCSLNNYLYKSNYWWWLLNPHGTCTHGIWEVSKTGGIDYGSAGYAEHAYTEEAGAVRPVLYLKSNIILSGEGTSSNPYTIEI